jgi:chromosome segregation ATPase
MELWIPVLVAVMSAGGPVMWFLVKFDRRNTNQHNGNFHILHSIKEEVVEVKTKVADLKHDVTGIKVDIVGLKTDVVDVKQEHKRMRSAAEKLSERLSNVEHPPA